MRIVYLFCSGNQRSFLLYTCFDMIVRWEYRFFRRYVMTWLVAAVHGAFTQTTPCISNSSLDSLAAQVAEHKDSQSSYQ